MAEQNDTLEQVKERILSAENILVALSKDPSVDEMAAAIGLTMMLDNAGKHATAIYSGKTPNALQFLNPEQTFEADTNSLQDFIIALNKEKADHLRYKVEGEYVRVYITPYKTEISEKDLEFSHGDFNVDLVIALNIDKAEHLDAALSEYGRIMHDATAVNITTGAAGNFAELEWSDPAKSSVSEMVVALANAMKEVKMGKEVATAYLTGIVAATERFSNDRTTPETMSVAAELMKAGADQKLIADNMELAGVSGDAGSGDGGAGGGAAEQAASAETVETAATDAVTDGEVEIKHDEPEVKADEGEAVEVAAPQSEEAKTATEQLEQMIAPTSEEENALEQLRQVANDVKLPEFKPGENPAEVIAPEMTEKEANNIPEMNFGGGDGVKLTPPSEAASVAEPSGEAALPEVTPEISAPEAGASAEINALEPEKPAEEMPIMGLEDIQLPPPPAPPVDTTGGAPELPKMEEPKAETPELPQIEIKEDATLGETPAISGVGGGFMEPPSETEGSENGESSESGDNNDAPAQGGETPGETEGFFNVQADEDPTAFKIPGV